MTSQALPSISARAAGRDLSSTAPASSLRVLARQIAIAIGKYWSDRRRRRIDRRAFRQLMELDDSLLSDIGVTRGEVRWANSLPLSDNAALELDKVARRNRKAHAWRAPVRRRR